MTNYRINDPKKGIIGPVGRSTVQTLMNAGVFGSDVQISRDNEPFQPLESFPELQDDDAATKAPREPTYAGDLGKNTFFKVFYRFHANLTTGLLSFKDGDREKDIFLEKGQPVFVTSNLPEERFGVFLSTRGIISPEELQRALKNMHEDGNRLGHTLIRLKMLTQEDVDNGLRVQQIDRLAELCDWETGRYLFFADEHYAGDRIDLNIDGVKFIAKAARDASEEGLMRRMKPYFQLVGSIDQAALTRANIELNEIEQKVLYAYQDGMSPLQVLSQTATTPNLRQPSLALLYLLTELDIIKYS
ncbi:hypothetical protein KAI87_08705 [Myxococcota bacterium]|nr:hypothetical protein [Myxococcota bacterium]